MARMPTGSPRSVPDPAGDQYDKMMRQWVANFGPGSDDKGPASSDDGGGVQQHGPHYIGRPGALESLLPVWGDARNALASLQEAKPIGKPGFAESLIPIWGSGREALADLQQGDYLGGAFNGALAVSDVVPVKALATAGAKVGLKLGAKAAAELGKGAIKDVIGGGLENAAKQLEKRMTAPGMQYPFKSGSQTWDASRKALRKQGFTAPGEDAHHWLIPQNGWGKDWPDFIKNQSWNIKALPRATHARLHTRYLGESRFNPLERYLKGTPLWWKATNTSLAGDGEKAVNSWLGDQ